MEANDIQPRIVTLFRQMQALNASDLFLVEGKEPHGRIFGQVQTLPGSPLLYQDFHEFIMQRLPPGLLDRLVTARDMDIGFSLTEQERYRLNLFYQKNRLALVARRVPSGAIGMADLRLPPTVRTLAEASRGLLLITGATGSGKSSTMAAILHHVNENFQRHIVTIEDPIEFIHGDLKSVVTQREVGTDTTSFSTSLRQVVRQSPDAIFIGEMRDLETIQTALSAAMTGHLVVSTMHTVDVAQTLERMVNYFPDHLRDQVALDLSLSLVGIVAQRLLPNRAGNGQVPVHEILVATPLVRQVIAQRRLNEIPELLKAGGGDGMMTFTRSLVDRYLAQEITLEVGAAAATNRHEFLLAVQGIETGIDTLRQAGQVPEATELSMKKLLKAAVRHGASDLLLTVGSAPVLRLNGELNELNLPPLKPADTQSLLFSLLNAPQRALFESTREIDFALSVNGLEDKPGEETITWRFRVNGFYQKSHVASALRVIPRQVPTARELGLPAPIMEMASKPHGLVLVTGPTGHGKSTTLACLINELNTTRSCHIITVEDPIEYVHTSNRAIIEQREVYADTQSFGNALKYILRQNPDVILIGEMRDQETIAAALTAAETGHLVLATLHTNDATQTIDRIIDSFPPHQQNQIRSQLASALVGVVAQRLLPRADGKGRIACFEIMLNTTPVQSLIRENRAHQIPTTIETSSKDGMITMDKALKQLYNKNLITRQTLRLMARNPELV